MVHVKFAHILYIHTGCVKLVLKIPLNIYSKNSGELMGFREWYQTGYYNCWFYINQEWKNNTRKSRDALDLLWNSIVAND